MTESSACHVIRSVGATVLYRLRDAVYDPFETPRYMLRTLLLSPWKRGCLSFHSVAGAEGRVKYLHEAGYRIMCT